MHRVELYDPVTNSFRKINLGQKGSNFFIQSLFEDSKGLIWVGSQEGLFRYDPANDKTLGILKKDGLKSEVIHDILEDEDENIWISTNGGIAKVSFSDDNFSIVNYDKDDGLPTNEFIKRAGFKNENGKLYFGSTNGLVSFYPSQIQQNSIAPVTALQKFEINGNREEAKESILELKSGSEVELDHNQSDFKITYVGLNYLNPQSTTYRIRLLGYEDDWQYAGAERSTNYTNLDPGEYCFEVAAANEDGVWTEKPTQLNIRIRPAWYERPLVEFMFYVSIAMVILTILILRDRAQKHTKEKLEMKVAERTEEIKELNAELETSNHELSLSNEEITSQRNELANTLKELEITMNKLVESEKLASLGVFTAGIAHEINNPLNYISGANENLFIFLDQLRKDKNLPEKDIEYLEQTKQYVTEGISRISNIVHGLRNYAKSDDENFIEYNIIQCIEDALIILENKIKMKIKVVKNFNNEVFIECQPGRISQIMINLIDNAADAVEESGTITIKVEKISNEVRITVEDSGLGISEENKKHIFDPFFTTKTVGKGTGLGLYMTHGFIKKHNGNISVSSKIGKGTKFTISFPVRQVSVQQN